MELQQVVKGCGRRRQARAKVATDRGRRCCKGGEISLVPLIKIFATNLMFCLADLIH
jgi:hypothetical protein